MDWLKPLNPRGEASAGDNHDTQVAWLRVMQGQASAGQIADARKVFARHLGEISLSLAGYHAITYNLPDGSKLRIVSNSGIHHAVLWPTSTVPVPKLPHGFAVVTNWASPKIFKRVVTLSPPGVEWKVDPVVVPQCGTDLEGDNQVFRATGATGYFNHPMVLTDGASRSRWDYLKHGAPALSSPNPVVPLCTQAVAGYSTGVMHWGVDNKIKNNAGTDIYTMTLSTAISTENPVHVPAATTSAGTEVILQHLRLFLMSPSTGIYTARFANERLTRLDEANYSLTERNVVSIAGPIGTGSPPGFTTPASSGEGITTELFANTGSIVQGTSFGGFRVAEGYADGSPLDLSSVIVTTGEGFAQDSTLTHASDTTYGRTVALPEAVSVLYPNLVVNSRSSGAVRWRSDYSKKYANPSDAPFAFFAWWGTYGYRKDRIDTNYSYSSAPLAKYELAWTNCVFLEGDVNAACTGGTYKDTAWKAKSLLWEGDILTYDYVTPSIMPSAIRGFYSLALAWSIANDIKPSLVSMLAGYPNWTGTEATTTTTIKDDRPVNNGSYTLTSRYVIDCDHKGQFYAAIKVIVTCAGAEWREGGGYEGNMVVYTDPSYTVQIYLETNWKGAVAQTLLTTASATRPAFEFISLAAQNPYHYFQPWLTSYQTMYVRVPPSFGLPIEAMTQIKNIAAHQGVNTHLVCADVRDDITGPAATNTQSRAGIEFSTIEGGGIRPHTKYVTGQLYARTFKLSDFPDALWLLHSTKCDASADGTGTGYYYMPALKTTIDTETFHVEVRDGVHETWSDEFMPGSGQPIAAAREIKLYRV